MLRRVLIALAVTCGFSHIAPAQTTTPLLIELFTAQGCPSCPPAEETLAELAKRSDLVVLAFHVDYWDNTGWRDKLALPVSEKRQNAYRRFLKKDQVYTPQLVVNGTVDLPGQDVALVDKVISIVRERTPPRPAVKLARAEGNMLSVTVDGSQAWREGEVWLAVYEPYQSVDIKRGKNRGKTVTNTNVVRAARSLGVYSGEAWSATIDVSDVQASQGIAVWVQPASSGPVAAAAALPPG